MESYKKEGQKAICNEGNEQSKNYFKMISEVSHERKVYPCWIKISVHRQHDLCILRQREYLSCNGLDVRRRPSVPSL